MHVTSEYGIVNRTSDRQASRTQFEELTVVLVLGVAAAFGMAFWMRSAPERGEPVGGLGVGEEAPVITAPEWVNGKPTEGEGRVRVVHAWFSTCPYCWKEAPQLVELHEKYGDRVEFIGLAFEGAEARDAVEDYVSSNGITWPNGFGEPFETLVALEPGGFPAAWVIDGNDVIVWSRDSDEPLQQAIERALKG